ncbi:PREDICTED: E3 ubiquitin-protein ligase SINA-like 2 [Camelina sativa]|uniref:RING-type E3 ubiquitin transferase n=1 Tax=Camelina sativa TaxID=90675 RepID=A0ABM0SRT0_CAMSA|nr:PREDICTED: E3 ubiquitin-protein ligase SINA-like 2 [Camelina sativa]
MKGEASSSRRKRQRAPAVAEGEEEAENGGGGDEVTRSGTMFELDLLDCPICCHALTIPIFQCDNGHIACSSCCTKVRNKCPSCTLPIGNFRSRIMERVVEAVIVPCPNAKLGCTEKFSYGKELAHEKKCRFALCYCPEPGCDFSGVYKDLYSHYYANHDDEDSWNKFVCGRSSGAWLHISDKILVLQESADGPLVVVQCFKEPQGFYVTVNCIAPSAPGVGEFSYHLSYKSGGKTMTFELEEMERIQKVSYRTPEKDFMLVPYYFQEQGIRLKMNICIRRLENNEEEEEDADEED